MHDMAHDVAVVGGGLTGVMMATALSHAGVEVVLVDRDGGRAPDNDERTTTINAAGARMLTALGVWDRLPTPPAPIRRIAIAERLRERVCWRSSVSCRCFILEA